MKIVYSRDFLIILLTGISIYYMIEASNFIPDYETSIFSKIHQNWYNSPIYDLRISDQMCSYDERNLLSISNFKDFKCDENLNCNIQEGTINEENLEYNFLVYNKTICIKQREDSYFTMNKVKNGEKCGNGYKKCGIIDTLENSLCVRTEMSCPYSVVIVNKNESNSNRTRFELNDNNTLELRNDTEGSKIISQLFFEYDEVSPCLTSKSNNVDCLRDESYNLISNNTVDIQKILDENNITLEFKNKNLFNIYSGYYFGYNLNCENQFENGLEVHKLLENFVIEIPNIMFLYEGGFKVMSTLLFLFILLWYIYVYYHTIILKNDRLEHMFNSMKSAFILNSFLIIIGIVCFYCLSDFYFPIKAYSLLEKPVKSKSCFDDSISVIFEAFFMRYNEFFLNFSYSVYSTIFIIILIEIDFYLSNYYQKAREIKVTQEDRDRFSYDITENNVLELTYDI